MEVSCIRLDDFGRGIAKIDGKITFISNFLPGEIAEVKITTSKKNYNEGEVVKIIKKSKNRIKPTCPYLNCGCHLKHLKYEDELNYKEEKIKNIITKFVKVDAKVNKIVFDDNMHYRNKITLKVKGQLGYFSNGSNDFIPISKCELVSDKVNQIISKLNKKDLSQVKEITIKDFNEIMIIIDGKMDISDLEGIIYMNGKLLRGNPYTETSLKGLTFKISKDSFFQVNKTLTDKLYDIAISYLGEDKKQTVLDLYCGTGTISLILSKYFKKVIGIEINEEAIKCAKENKKINHIDNVTFICGDVSEKIENIEASKVIVDPPRSGLTKKAINDILKINPDTLVYISCNPITLARDLNLLKKAYKIVEVTPVNMFPRTYHVESVIKLTKK